MAKGAGILTSLADIEARAATLELEAKSLRQDIAEMKKSPPCPIEEGEQVSAHLSADSLKAMIANADYLFRPNQIACDVQVVDGSVLQITSRRATRDEALKMARVMIDGRTD